MNFEQMLRLSGGQILISVKPQAALQFRQHRGGQCKTDGECMPAEASKEIGAVFDCVKQLKAVDRSA